MFLEITGEIPGADLGFLLHKHPDKLHSFELSYGTAHVFYPLVTETRCTVALVVDLEPTSLMRGVRSRATEEFTLGRFVNERPYAASSFLSVAIGQVFSSAMAGRSKHRPELVDQPFRFSAVIAALPCPRGGAMVRDLFEPLGYAVAIAQPEQTFSTVTISGLVRLRVLLSHLYVLIPALDADKHYWVGEAEVENLLRKGEGWLAAHPARDQIVARSLKFKKDLTSVAIERLTLEEPEDSDNEAAHLAAQREEVAEEPLRLWQQRMASAEAVLKAHNARRVVDLGCGEGKLLRALAADRFFEEILGMDVSIRSLEIAAERLRLDTTELSGGAAGKRVRLIQGSLMYRDTRLCGFDAATVLEVIEHLEPPRLAAFEQVLFEFASPRLAILTTPNAEYNVHFENLPSGAFRHGDHRFEWTRAEFQAWSTGVASRFGYQVSFLPVGPDNPNTGPPTQMAVFTK